MCQNCLEKSREKHFKAPLFGNLIKSYDNDGSQNLMEITGFKTGKLTKLKIQFFGPIFGLRVELSHLIIHMPSAVPVRAPRCLITALTQPFRAVLDVAVAICGLPHCYIFLAV